MSGMTKTFLSARISSATEVVGPLAPSARILQRILSAFLLVMTFSVARGAGETNAGCVALSVVQQIIDVDAVAVVKRAVVLDDTDDLVTSFEHQLGGVRADVAESLDDDARALAAHAQLFQGLIADDHQPAAGSLAASARTAHIHRLADDHGSNGLPHVHGIGIHHPGHDLLVGAHIRGGNILFRPDEFHEFGGVAAGDPFQLGERKFFGIADDATLGAAKRDIHYRALPGHPACQGADFIEGDVRGITDAAFGRAAGDGVLHAIAGKNLDAAILHGYRDVHDDLAGGIAQDLPQAVVEVEFLRGVIEARRLRHPGIKFLIERCDQRTLNMGGHETSPSESRRPGEIAGSTMPASKGTIGKYREPYNRKQAWGRCRRNRGGTELLPTRG